MPIGVLGGTFDPVHCGHLRIAIEARETLGLEHVRLVPLNAPGHREPPFASVADRIAMLEAVAGDGLRLDRREIERGGTSYTVDTLESMRAEWPKRPLCLLMGLDSYLTLPAWHRADALPAFGDANPAADAAGGGIGVAGQTCTARARFKRLD